MTASANPASAQRSIPPGVTIIPDGDNQPRVSAAPGEVFALDLGDRTKVENATLLTLDDAGASFFNAGIAQTSVTADEVAPAGPVATVSVEADNGFARNYEPAVIASQETAIDISGDKGAVLNDGLISGALNGVRLVGDDGLLKNYGNVESDSRAVEIIGSGNKVVNDGDITGTGDQRNGTIYANSTAEDINVVNGEHGSVDAGFDNNGTGISFELGNENGEVVSADIINHGSIAGRGDAEQGLNTRGDGVRLFSGVSDGTTTYDGDIVNTGWITSDNARGIEIRDGLAFDGKIVNTLLIFGETDGLYFGDAAHDATVANRGVIASDSRALNIDGTGVDVHNSGTILATDAQRNGTVYADSTADDYSLVNLKRGVVDGTAGGSAVALQTGEVDGDTVSAVIKNYGKLLGGGDAVEGNGVGDGLRLFSDVQDATFQGDLYNAGLIKASTESDVAVGISIEDGVALHGKILNYGRILANETAIDATEAGGHVDVVNFGLIHGDVDLSTANDSYDGTHGQVTGTVDGGAGHDVLTGGFASDALAGGAHDDQLTGGYGGDVFVFRKADAESADVITDFEDGLDRIDVSDFGFSGASDIGVEQDGQDAVLTFADDNTVTLLGIDAADIGAGDFLF